MLAAVLARAGPPDRDPRRCWHYAEVPLDGLPDWGWYDKCTRCGSETSGVRLVTVGLS
jgi:hypothetical protein